MSTEIHITAELLREKQACVEGVDAFVRRFGEDGVLIWYGDERDARTIRREKTLRPYLDWVIEQLELSPDLRGWLSPDLRGTLSPGLRGTISPYLRGDITGITGDITDCVGEISHIRGRLTPRRAKVLGLISKEKK